MEKTRDHETDDSLADSIRCDVEINALKIRLLTRFRVIAAVVTADRRKSAVFLFFDLISLRYQIIKCVGNSIVKYISVVVQFLNVQ